MKIQRLFIFTLPLILAACGDDGVQQQTAGEEGTQTSESRLKKEAGEWMKETKELGAAAWDATKEKTAEYAEKTGEYYETAKEKSKEYYEARKREGQELYEEAKVKGAEIYEDAKAEIESRQGEPPQDEPAR